MDDEYVERLRQHLDYEHTRTLLMQAGLLLLAKDLVTSAVVGDVKGFFCDEMDANLEPLASDEYRTVVLDHGRKKDYRGCLDWLVAAEVLTDEHLATISLLKKERDRVAHEALGLVFDPDFALDPRPILGGAEVLRVIGRFFGRLNAAADPAFDHVEIAEADIQSGKSIAYSQALSAMGDMFSGGQ
jgi:hypothetical protein